MEKLIISACLLGTPCRYDNRSKPNKEVIALASRYELIPVCPEVLGGLPTPRIPAEICKNRVIRADGVDITKEYEKGAKIALEIAKKNNCKIAILKEKSPSCGYGFIYDGTHTKTLTKGNGITAKLFEENGIIIINERELYKLK